MADDGDKGRDWFICDVCEEERDLRLSVYYCSNGCAYITEIKCVISQVRLLFSREYGEIELRSAILKHEGGKVIERGIAEQSEPLMEEPDQYLPFNSEYLFINNYRKVSGREELVICRMMPEVASPSESEKCYITRTDEKGFSGSDEYYTEFISLIDTMD